MFIMISVFVEFKWLHIKEVIRQVRDTDWLLVTRNKILNVTVSSKLFKL